MMVEHGEQGNNPDKPDERARPPAHWINNLSRQTGADLT
jgi:hypothetical protein